MTKHSRISSLCVILALLMFFVGWYLNAQAIINPDAPAQNPPSQQPANPSSSTKPSSNSPSNSPSSSSSSNNTPNNKPSSTPQNGWKPTLPTNPVTIATDSDTPASPDSPSISSTPVVMPTLPSASGEDHGLAYDGLTAQQQEDYDAILKAVKMEQPSASLKAQKADEVDIEYLAVIADHPEVFWSNGYSYTNAGSGIVLKPRFTMSEEVIKDTQGKIDAKVRQIFANLPANATTYDKVKYFYDWIVDNTEYDLSAPFNQTIQSVLLGGRSVCAGYAKTFEYLCQLSGVPCSYVWGDAFGERHGWNYVVIDSVPTWVDVTFGDPIFESGQNDTDFGRKNYDYLCVTSDEIKRVHTISPEVRNVPQCDSTQYDYARRAGTYLDSYSNDKLNALVDRFVQRGESKIVCKMANEKDFKDAVAYVQGAELMKGPLAKRSTYWYSLNSDLYIIAIAWT